MDQQQPAGVHQSMLVENNNLSTITDNGMLMIIRLLYLIHQTVANYIYMMCLL